MTIRRNAILFLSSACGLGYMPFAPGTIGSLVGLPLCWMLAQLPLVGALVILAALVGSSVWIAGQAEQLLQQKDPGVIVIDEVCGLAVALMGLPFTVANGVLGFVLFRILDIAKPVPIRTLERRIAGGAGIVVDDVVAGIMVNIVLRILSYLINII